MSPFLFAVFAAAGAAVAYCVGNDGYKATAYVVAVVAAILLWQASLGHPRPLWGSRPEAIVLAYAFDEPRAIYLWIESTGSSVPEAIELPWNESEAAELASAMAAGARQRRPVEMRGSSARRGEARGRPMFYPAPVPPLAAKTTP